MAPAELRLGLPRRFLPF